MKKMTTTEKMFVQIFDRKRSIVERLKQHKQRYDEHLASKLLIQGITPPNWLLNSEIHPSCSASDLISGILLPNPAHDTFVKTCASSNGSQGYKPSIIPSYHTGCTEDGATIVPPCHNNDTQDTLNYVPMSPEDQTNTMNPSTSVNQDESLARIHRSRSRQKALQLRNSGKETAKSCLGKENNYGIPSGNKALGYDEANDDIRESVDLSWPSILPTRISEEAVLVGYSDKEKGVYVCRDFSSQSKGHEAQNVQTVDEEKIEKQSNVTVGRHTRSKSHCSKSITGQYESNRKSHETCMGRGTKSGSGKAQLPEIEDPPKQRVIQSNSSQIQPIDGNQAIENSQDNSDIITKPRSSGANGAKTENRKSRTKDEMSVKSKGNEAQEVQTEYEEKMEKQSNVTVGRYTRSRSHCSKSITEEYESNRKSHETCMGRGTRSRSGMAQLPENEEPLKQRLTQSNSSQIQPMYEYQAIENSQVNSGIITKPSSGENEAKTENRKSQTKDEMSVNSKGNEAQEVQTEYEEKMEKQSNVTVGRHKRFRSHCSKSITGDYESYRKSHEIYVGRVTRSRSGKAQLPEIEDSLEKRDTQSIISQIQPIDGIQAIENSQVNSGRITKPRSSGANEAKREYLKRATNDEMSVKPKQLDFDEGEETCLADILAEGKGCLKDNTKDKPAALPCAFSVERVSEKCKSLAFETQEAFEIEVDLSLPKSNKISSHTSLLDRQPDSPGTEEHMIGINDEYSAGPSSSVPNVNMSTGLSSRKRMFEPDEEQELNKEASYLSLPNTDSVHTMSLHSDSEPTLRSEEARHDLSSCNDSDKISYVGLCNPDTKATMSLHRDAVDATLSAKQNSDVTRSEHPYEVLQSGSQERNARLQNSCLFGNVEVGCFELPEVRAGIDVLPKYDVNNAVDGSWPCYKRGKIRYQVHSKSASPRVTVNTSLCIYGNIQNESMDCEKKYSCLPQKLVISHDSDGMFPNHDIVVNTSLGINGTIQNESMDDKKEHSSCISKKLVISQDSDGMFLNPEFIATAAHGIKYLESEESELTPKVQHGEGKISLGRSVMISFTCEEKQLPSRVANLKQDIIGEPSDCFSQEEFKDARTCAVQRSGRLYPDLEFDDMVGQGNCADELIFTKTILDKYDAVESVEFESFIIDGKRESVQNAAYGLLNGKIPFMSELAECTKLPDPIDRPTSLSTPSSPFPTVYTPYYTPGVYRSVPNGLIEKIDLTGNLLSNDDIFRGKSYPNYSFPSRRPGYDFAKPFISRVGKGFEEIESGSSSEQLRSNPEHICFPIQEDLEMSKEDMSVCDTPGTEINGAYLNQRTSHIREPMRDITLENKNILASGLKVERGSLEPVTTEISIAEKHKQDSKKSEMHQRSIRTRQGKANHSLSIDANSIKKHSDSLSSRYSKPKLSGKSSLRSRGASLSEKEPKRTNIVSNLKSFIPLVRQKQESSGVPVKKEVKVKALEAAEEAKRKEEKKENERKQKREALKLERARSKQENLKQMELKRKQEEIERKRKESENVAKKRQREEERKDKQRKKQRIEDARCLQKQAEQKIHAWREQSRSENEDGRADERKYSNDKVERAPEQQNTRNPVNELAGNDVRETDNTPPSTNDNKSSTGSSDTGMVGKADVTDISTPNCDKIDERINEMREQSYDISPYQCSDDEEEEEDDMPSKKFIPTWASKSSVSVALSWMKQMDPDTIFSPGSFCSLDEVLLPRRLVQK